jgi:hypothetical protein
LKLRNEAGPTCQSQQPLNRSHPVTGSARDIASRSPCLHATPRGRPHVSCALSSRCSSLRSPHNSPLSHTPAHSCRRAARLALPRRHAAAPRTSTAATVATEKHLHADRHLRPQNRPADATANTVCSSDFSPSHEPVATTTGRCSPRRSPPTDLPPPWSMFHDEFSLSPPPKIRPPSRRHASQPFPPPPLTAGHRNRPASPSPVRQRPGLPCLSVLTVGHQPS